MTRPNRAEVVYRDPKPLMERFVTSGKPYGVRLVEPKKRTRAQKTANGMSNGHGEGSGAK